MDKQSIGAERGKTPPKLKGEVRKSYPYSPSKIMALFQITTKRTKNCNGVRIEAGLSVQVVTPSPSNPVSTNGGQVVADAFMRMYGIDIKRAGCLNNMDLEVVQVG